MEHSCKPKRVWNEINGALVLASEKSSLNGETTHSSGKVLLGSDTALHKMLGKTYEMHFKEKYQVSFKGTKPIVAFFLLILSVLVSGCGAVLKGPKMSEVHSQLTLLDQNSARVFFIRPGYRPLGGKARIHVNKKRTVELPLSGCHYENVSVGKHNLMLDMWGGLGSHDLDVVFQPASNRYFKVWPRTSRAVASVLFSVLGSVGEKLLSEKNNDGELEFTELTEEEAVPLLEKCVHYREES